MLLRVHLTYASYLEFFSSFLGLILDPLVIAFAEFCQSFELIDIPGVLVGVVIEFETVGPASLVQIKKHLLLTFILTVVYSD